MRRSPFAWLVVPAIALLACYYAYSAYVYSAMMVAAHAPTSVAVSTAVSPGVKALLLLVAAVAYARFPDLRTPLQVVAVLGGVYGLVLLIRGWNFPHSWYIFGGDMIAIDFWSMVLLMAIAILAIADAALTRFQRERRLRAFRT